MIRVCNLCLEKLATVDENDDDDQNAPAARLSIEHDMVESQFIVRVSVQRVFGM